ncbi:hypothetical protein CALCODRAFT_307949 [Calocera cornea HHB12733]|uniref:C2H2-type domain-containing protein n=1 Tax=Calocera cornea HHB12733 TaxID=1353952 RepID=A0A165JNC6_9BASI|nr:hypothetical protein CALCODRAFT_307949 [Calocera cornea HHB12733]
MSAFTIRSSAAGLVSLLNDDDEAPNTPRATPLPSSPSSAKSRAYEEPAKPLARRRFECKLCTKVFTTSGHLTRHGKVHSGVKTFACPIPGCRKKTARQDNLTQHYRMHMPKPERKAPQSYVRARLDEARSTVSQIDSQVDEGQTQQTRHGSSSDVASHTPPGVCYQLAPASQQYPPARLFAGRTEPRVQDYAAHTLTGGSNRSIPPLSHVLFPNTPMSSIGNPKRAAAASPSSSKIEGKDIGQLWSLTRTHQSYATSFARSE